MSGQFGSVLYYLLLAAMFFLMMRFGCGAHMMGHGHRHGAKNSDDQVGDSDGRWIAPERAIDPVCGMTVQTVGAKSALRDGHVYYFCSQECRAKFEAAPASYAKIAA
jgi:YHS domain-containing protein